MYIGFEQAASFYRHFHIHSYLRKCVPLGAIKPRRRGCRTKATVRGVKHVYRDRFFALSRTYFSYLGTGTTVFPLPGSFPWSAGIRGTAHLVLARAVANNKSRLYILNQSSGLKLCVADRGFAYISWPRSGGGLEFFSYSCFLPRGMMGVLLCVGDLKLKRECSFSHLRENR